MGYTHHQTSRSSLKAIWRLILLMTQKYYPATTIRLILIIIGISGILLRNMVGSNDTVTTILFIIQLVALDAILKESDIFTTIYFRVIQVAISIYIIGSLCKIMHWPGADFLLIAAISLVVIIYIVRTVNKKQINILDITKCCWVISVCFTAIASLLHLPLANVGSYINLGLFGAMLLLFFLSPVKESREEKKHYDTPLDQVD